MGRALILEGGSPAAHMFLDHFTFESVVRAMDNLGMIQDLNILDLARVAFHRALPGRPLSQIDPGDVHTVMGDLRAVGAAEPTGIPRHKLATAESWLIISREITAALAAYQQAEPERREAVAARIDEWTAFVDFLHLAGDHAGLRSN
ncbi:hypothetical protein ACFV4P_03020 [Kitasatospora sp. NPDC059795]|uniref:hypothetical protein n=1 Tax=Kitasatospora sp. NPDC059795 TaxID=3346949 RepID=UPI003663F89D